MAATVSAQVAQTRENVRRMNDDFNTFQAAVDTRFTTLRNSLFEDHNHHFGALEQRLDAIQQRFRDLDDQLGALDRRFTEHNQQLAPYNERLTERLTAINQRATTVNQDVTTLSGRLNTLDRDLRAVLTPIGRRFDTIDHQLERSITLAGPVDGRFNAVDQRLQALNQLLGQRFDTIDATLASFDRHPHLEQLLEHQLAHLDTLFHTLNQRLDTVDSHVDQQLQPFTQRFDNLNQRQNEIGAQIHELTTALQER